MEALPWGGSLAGEGVLRGSFRLCTLRWMEGSTMVVSLGGSLGLLEGVEGGRVVGFKDCFVVCLVASEVVVVVVGMGLIGLILAGSLGP